MAKAEEQIEIYDPDVDAYRMMNRKDIEKIIEKGKQAEKMLAEHDKKKAKEA